MNSKSTQRMCAMAAGPLNVRIKHPTSQGVGDELFFRHKNSHLNFI
jgi:hypothetical protein